MHAATPLITPFRGDDAERRQRIDKRLSASAFLADPFRRLRYDSSERWAWDNYRATVLSLAQARRRIGRGGDVVRMLEVGGGRGPLLQPAEAAAAGIAVTINDIDARELSFAPKEFDKAEFDISGDIDPTLSGAFDLIVSRMVMEHVGDARRAWSNIAALLKPSGVAMAFHPTLYAPPFLINLMLPDTMTGPVLRWFFPNRHDGDYPKFPARYQMCVSDPARVGPILRSCGFREALIVPFWGHGYFRAVPGLRELDAALQRLAEARDWRALTTYAYTLARR
ncbi:MAG TPA: methyltransferase domain-containing protein [Roseiarcus sp.]|nr:methyltransferase domain-containing protein [Roseiarcus sp.]